MDPSTNSAGNPSEEPAPARDYRLYLPDPETWSARVKVGWEKEYCFAKLPGQDYLHLLLSGEIYIQRGDEKLCLWCAMRRNILTEDRLYWQNRPRVASIPVSGL
ncbi:MAG: hypothetical protein KF774_16000 [Planctomyces sp.]|nr:hypothetical protein [Planctomyces sp.]